jgi:LmbE family N-acetylglucosaminyl deacetylase
MNKMDLLCTEECKDKFKTVLIIAAHPDDEIIGAGDRLTKMNNIFFIHSTDGAPKNMKDSLIYGFENRRDYIRKRREEFFSALKHGNIQPEACFETGIPDQETSFNLQYLTKFLLKKINEINPDLILTHPYEGGHPDHDSTSFAVNSALKLLNKSSILIEFSSYFNKNGGMAVSDFINQNYSSQIRLTEPERIKKKLMLDCFKTQKNVLNYFHIEKEVFRKPPVYDYTLPPHSGTLYYELFDWGIKGEQWRKLAYDCLAVLDII